MSDRTPNEGQQQLIDDLDGIYKVDAGPGTGKTFSITRRYANLLESRDVTPEDVLLFTFTRNAATEMKDRIIDHTEYRLSALRDAPINTFHGIANQLLRRYGFEAPTHLGIDDRYAATTAVVDDDVLEREQFREFLLDFSSAHPEYDEFLRVLSDPASLLGIINQLAAKGVFPTRDGWYRNGEAYLDGDIEAFLERFETANEPNEGATGPTQSDLRRDLGGFERDSCYLPDAPSESELRGDGPQIPRRFAREAFEEDRSGLKAFVHDVYFAYIEFALGRNYVTFGFLQMFAYVLLMEEPAVRRAVEFEYVMIDEFQDTSEIQFKLALLLAGEPNLCVVGDWKQSIYSFQYAAVANIRSFEDRLGRFVEELNEGKRRVEFPVDDVESIALTENYRSTQDILGFTEQALTLEATADESLDPVAIREEITALESKTAYSDSRIEGFTAEDEYEGILHRIQTIVDNPDYAVEDATTGEMRPPRYSDITILTRTREFGRAFQTAASQYSLPVAYDGEVELLQTDQALLVLAWLRILEDGDSERGWAVVLEEAGYRVAEVEYLLETGDYPDSMVAFRESLLDLSSIEGVARRVLDRYGFDDAYADGVIELLERTVAGSTLNRGDVIRFIEDGINSEVTYPVDDTPGENSVTVQTIHATKGLEHPIVIVANVNQRRFPSHGGSRDRIPYDDPIGLRQSKRYAEAHGRPHLYDNWRYPILSKCLSGDYDEERRLMYVAMSRAKHHLLFSAGENPSPFFEGLPLEPVAIDPDVDPFEPPESTQTTFDVPMPVSEAPEGYSAHDLMDDSVFESEDRDGGRGMAFGQAVHDFAEAYTLGNAVVPENDDQREVKAFIDTLEGRKEAEIHAFLPLEVDERDITVSGIIDLLHVTEDTVEIIDFKTDRTRRAQPEYRTQLSVYYHVVAATYPAKTVSTSLYYTHTGDRVFLDPIPQADLRLPSR